MGETPLSESGGRLADKGISRGRTRTLVVTAAEKKKKSGLPTWGGSTRPNKGTKRETYPGDTQGES